MSQDENTGIETTWSTSGVPMFRMRCAECGRTGIWHPRREVADHVSRIHQSHEHGKAAA